MPRKKPRTYRTLSMSEDLERVGMVQGRREPLYSLLPKLRLLQKRKELRQIQPSPPSIRQAPDPAAPLEVHFPALSPIKKRKSLPINVFPENSKLHVSPFERKILTKETKVLIEACEELFPGDPLVLHQTSDPLPARLIYDIPVQPLSSRPKRPANRYSPARVTMPILESLLEYDPKFLPKVNVSGLEQARNACIQPVKPQRLPPIINTPASLHLPSTHLLP